jgi:Bacterial Ig domain/Calcineurin-like phosphoesterase
MNKLIRFLVLSIIVFGVISSPLADMVQRVSAAPVNCADSLSTSTLYTVEVCITSPAVGATLSANATITGTVSVISGTTPGVQRMVFYLNGVYLMTDYSSPYTFTLPTNRWVDGAYTLSAEALMRDAFTSAQASIPLTFSTGTSTPPVNPNTFTPTSGRPAGGQPFVVAAVGDGAGGEATATSVTNLIASVNPNLFLYIGDVYEKGSVAEFYNWYGSGSNFFSQFRSITDPTIGNHDYLTGDPSPYFYYWDNVPDYYSFNADGWHFISLNSNSSFIGVGPTSAQYLWLQQDLAANTAPCTIAFYHHTYFSIGPEGNKTAMVDIWKLLAQNHVDIVLNGHNHDYERWVPLDGDGVPSLNGMTEFVLGVGGHSMQTVLLSDSRVAFWTDANPAAFGALFLTLHPTYASFSFRSGSIPCVDPGMPIQANYIPVVLH